MTAPNAKAALAAVLAAFAAAGCGIKGPLTLPEKSENIVIRAPAGNAGTTQVPAEGAITTRPAEAPATPEATRTPVKPKPERPPPPPLPSSNPGTGQGG